jgi:hypothetical protein
MLQNIGTYPPIYMTYILQDHNLNELDFDWRNKKNNDLGINAGTLTQKMTQKWNTSDYTLKCHTYEKTLLC